MLQAGQLEAFASHLLHVESIGQVCLTHSPIIRNILTQCQFAVNLEKNGLKTLTPTDRLTDSRIPQYPIDSNDCIGPQNNRCD